MTDLNKKIKLGTIINFIILAVIFVLCYFITSSDFTGACSECAAGDSMNFFMGGMFLFIQGILGIFMFFSAKNIEKTRYTGGVISFAVISILIMLIQIGVVFSTTLELHTHEESISGDSIKFDIINGLYNVGRVLYVLMLAYYIALIVMSILSSRQMKKEDAEEM